MHRGVHFGARGVHFPEGVCIQFSGNKKLRTIDMFPHTAHVESVVLMSRVNL